MVVDYNTNMSGIDRVDQMMSYYPIPIKKVCVSTLQFFSRDGCLFVEYKPFI